MNYFNVARPHVERLFADQTVGAGDITIDIRAWSDWKVHALYHRSINKRGGARLIDDPFAAANADANFRGFYSGAAKFWPWDGLWVRGGENVTPYAAS